MAEKYKMVDYIYESGAALERTFSYNSENITDFIKQLKERGIDTLILTGIGSSYTASMMAFPLFRGVKSLAVHVIPSTELSYYHGTLINEKTAVISISRSGERDWVVNAMKDAAAQGALAIAVSGVDGSSLAKSASQSWITGEGPEASFPKTKSVIACSGLMMYLAAALLGGENRDNAQLKEILLAMPERITKSITQMDQQAQELTAYVDGHATITICGSGANYGTALEAAIKLQETSLIPTAADDTGNFLHGPLMPLNEKWLVLQLMHKNDEKLSRQLLETVKGIGAHTLCIFEPSCAPQNTTDHFITIPYDSDWRLAPLLYLPAIQLINYHLAVARGLNPDNPDVAGDLLKVILPPGRSEPDYQ